MKKIYVKLKTDYNIEKINKYKFLAEKFDNLMKGYFFCIARIGMYLV